MTQGFDVDRLFDLLPAVYRLRDEENGQPLRALLAAFADQLAALEENVAQLYDDQFIETCADWVVPYIGDLIGYRPLQGPTAAVASPRAEVANTIRARRRKGTAASLEDSARDVTGCPARVVEYFEYLATTQHMNHVRLHAPATANLRDQGALLRAGGAFDRLPHTVDVRHPETSGGRHNIPNIGIFLWRLRSLPLSAIPLTPDRDDATGRKFRVNPLGVDIQLFRRKQAEDDVADLSRPIHVPEPLAVRLLALAVRRAQASTTPPPGSILDDDYGVGESLVIFEGEPAVPVAVARIRVCDLRDIVDPATGTVSGWNHEAALTGDQIGIDPERGRVLLGPDVQEPARVTFHYGSVRAIGGGEYERGGTFTQVPDARRGEALQAKLDGIAGGGTLLIGDSFTYREASALVIKVAPKATVIIAARNGARPIIASGGEIVLDVGPGGTIVFDGVILSSSALRLAASADTEARQLVLRDCTLLPELGQFDAPTLIAEHPFAKIALERCISGPLLVVADAEVTIRDSIVDAGAADGVAFAGDATGGPGATLVVERSTLIGKVHTQSFTLGSNSIFYARLGDAPAESWRAPLIAERRQEGCLRFSYVPEGSIVPRRHACVPSAAHPKAVPEFSSLRYGDASYAQLRDRSSSAIRTGAEHGSEMGVLHELHLPIRENNLRTRLDESLRFGLHAGIFHAT